MSEELKSCPFCGQPAVTSHELTTNDVVYCGNPTCPANWSGVDLKTWNTRPEEDRLLRVISSLHRHGNKLSRCLAVLVGYDEAMGLNRDDEKVAILNWKKVSGE